MVKKLRERTLNEVRESAEYAVQNGRCVTVSAKWLIGLLNGVEAVAKLAAKTPQFFNPLDVYDAEAFRDHVLRQREARNPQGVKPCGAGKGS